MQTLYNQTIAFTNNLTLAEQRLLSDACYGVVKTYFLVVIGDDDPGPARKAMLEK